MIKPQNKMLFIIGFLLVICYLIRLNQRPVYVCNYNNIPPKLNVIEEKLLQEAEDDIFFYLIKCNQTMYQYAKKNMPERFVNVNR